ncbi:HNH endonuclease [Peribacillus simplex]|uniref:HNH endonuclease n=1 Tax=Peribacillus simplex TaxID=1478 RepID=A0A9X8ZDN8_9BACI|nr:HNH endonuclease [Peribacillus simplex]TKH01333.1 HNH endonuclease [Peribacillus simplex]TKH08014.1 HNH endonuclease [Peribacillus simplex]
MSLIRGVGKFAGKAAGFVVGKPIQFVGELTGVELIEDIGKGVRDASEFAGDTVGQVAAGAVDTVSGIINDDSTKRDKGFGEMGTAVTRTAKGVVVTAKNTIQNGGDVIGGMIDGDNDRVKKGATSLVKTVAIGALAVGVVDFIDGVDGADTAEAADTNDTKINNLDPEESVRIETANDHLVGSEHPETGVPFTLRTVELPNGEDITGVFPSFNDEYEVNIDESLYLQTDYVQFSYANQELYDHIQDEPELAEVLGLSSQEVAGLSHGDTLEGFTWHHNEEPGVLQLVNQDIHAITAHTGGRELWGGGSDYR